MEQERIVHPSYGQIAFSRVNGTADFYGSELTQDHYINMTVTESEQIRDLTTDRYFAHGKRLIHLRMTAGQFSELITSLNTGGGVPCTVEIVDGKRIEPYKKIESKKEYTHRAFRERMVEFSKTLKEKQDKSLSLIKKKTLSKDDIQNLGNYITWMTQEVSSNIPFFAKMFQETTDKVVQEAKMEVENAIQHKIGALGLNALHEQQKLLE